MSSKVLKDQGRLERLEKIFSDSHICEMQARFNEIKCSADKCENCPLGFESGVCLKNTFEHKWKLQEENQELKKKNRQLLNDSSTLAVKIIKLEKVLEIIKDKCYFMPLSKIKNLSYHLYVRWFDLNHYDVKSLLTREEFDSLKEVLYNESC